MTELALHKMASDMPFVVSPLRPGLQFGAMVEGLGREHLDRPDVRRALVDLWIDRGVILFRGDDSEDMQVALSNCFGELEPHMFPETRVADRQQLTNIKYYPGNGTLYEIDGEPRGGWLPWHSDLIYRDRINRGGILRAIQLPQKGGGQTGFIDQIAAYDRLPQHLRERIEGLHVVYGMDLNAAHFRFGVREQRKLVAFAQSALSIMRREFQYPRVLHPMVFEQQETGRKVLNVSPAFALGIYELGGPEGEDLLHEVIGYCIDPAHAHIHDWQVGDMLLWDNWRTLHSATGVAPDDTRVMHRTTIKGDYALGRRLDGDGRPAEVDY